MYIGLPKDQKERLRNWALENYAPPRTKNDATIARDSIRKELLKKFNKLTPVPSKF